MAFGPDLKNINDAIDDLFFFGVLGVMDMDGGASLSKSGMRLLRLIGGGAAESKDVARVDGGLVYEGRLELSSPSRKIAGLISSSVQGRTLESNVSGRDSRSSSATEKGSDIVADVEGL